MYRAFNLIDSNWENLPRDTGGAIFKQNCDRIKKSLEPFLLGEIVDGTKLSENWFPTIESDIFISHSHQDEEKAIKCAGWLNSVFGLDCFVDSCVWGHADVLLKIIDEKFCLNPGGETYGYEKRNGSTSHVHMMLSAALSAMLDAAECVIFIKTENSITSKGVVDKTQSPWIFYELSTMRVMRRKVPSRMSLAKANQVRGVTASKYQPEYEVPLKELTRLTDQQLIAWQKSRQSAGNTKRHSLDLLYEIVGQGEN